MKTKGTLLAAGAVGALMSAPSAFALSDHPSLCTSYQREWQSRSQGTLAGMLEFINDPTLKKMCPKTEGDAALRIATEQVKKQDAEKEKAKLELVVSNKASKAEVADATKRLAALETSVEQDRKAREAAEAAATEERRKRMELEAAAAIPGRTRNLLACSISQDVEKLDQGNMENMKFDNIDITPEIQVVYDIADVSGKAVDVYGFDLTQQQWSRTRVGALLKGTVLSLGATSQSLKNIQIKEKSDLDLGAMTIRGRAMVEPAASGGPSLFNLDVGTGKAGLNMDALTKRPPRVWVELRGNCAYQNGDPPGPLTGTPQFRVTSRDIPNVPKP